jgi:hypothetical protein
MDVTLSGLQGRREVIYEVIVGVGVVGGAQP